MKNQPQPTVHSGEELPFLDGSNTYLFFSLSFWNKLIAVCRAVLLTRDWQVTENGIQTAPGSAGGGSTSIRGQWDPAPTDGPYKANQIVFFTPDGDYASTFYALQDVPAGVSPDTGAPYWASFPNSPAGLWA